MTKRKAKEDLQQVGRPSDYTPELGDLICAGIAEGKSLARICKPEDYPGTRTVYTWLRTHPEFQQNYENAKEDQADYMVEELLEIADDGRNDYMEKLDGEGNAIGYQLNGENIQRSRLRTDVRKWAASKFKSKKYGDRITTEHTGNIGLTDMTSEELERKKQELENALKQSERD